MGGRDHAYAIPASRTSPELFQRVAAGISGVLFSNWVLDVPVTFLLFRRASKEFVEGQATRESTASHLRMSSFDSGGFDAPPPGGRPTLRQAQQGVQLYQQASQTAASAHACQRIEATRPRLLPPPRCLSNERDSRSSHIVMYRLALSCVLVFAAEPVQIIGRTLGSEPPGVRRGKTAAPG